MPRPTDAVTPSHAGDRPIAHSDPHPPAGDGAPGSEASAAAPPGPDDRIRTRALAVIAAVLVAAALRASEPVTLPLVLAVFLIAFTRPLYRWVARHTYTWLALLAATLVVLLVLAVVAGAVALSVAQVAEQGPALVRRAERLGAQIQSWLAAHGLPAPSGESAGGAVSRIASVVEALLASTGSMLTLIGITLAFYVLGLLEVDAFRDKARRALRPGTGEAVVDTVTEIAHRVRGYLVAVTITSLVGGAAAGVFAFAVGLGGALTWGLVTYLLNYIPTIGPFLSVVPPTLYAFVEGGSLGHVALVFLGLGAIQFFIGNFFDPRVAGSRLSLSPLAVLVAVTFWGWVWGIIGALLAVPITVATVVVCARFERTRWIAAMLGGGG